jgi:hypothetical protein
MPSLRVALVAVLAAGCTERPKAPPLTNEAVYQNDKIGLRFLAPEGWSITARTDLPGTLPRPVTVVSYAVTHAGKSADLEVTAADLPDGTDLGAFLAGYQVGAQKWALKKGPDDVTVNTATAKRFLMSAGKGKDEVQREATAFRRGGRVYFFLVSFPASEPDRRDQGRKSVESVTFTK